MTVVDLFGLLVPASFLLLLLIEALFPARRLTPRRGWRWLGVGFLVMMGGIGTLLPLLVPPEWAVQFRLLDTSSWAPAPAFLLGWSVYTLLGFAWHRAVHASPLLWRMFHQVHHAPTRLDVASSSVFHPLESVAYTVLTTLVTVFFFGLQSEVAAAVGFFAAFVSFLQHANLKTPTWLGYFVQRPEAHALHHAVGGPRGNYSDMPLWDLVFGSFRNPTGFETEVGFPGTAEHRWGAMLAFVDVSADSAKPCDS